MSLKGTPYYQMARDAGASDGEEAEQLAQKIQRDHIATQREEIEEKSRARQAELHARAHAFGVAICDDPDCPFAV